MTRRVLFATITLVLAGRMASAQTVPSQPPAVEVAHRRGMDLFREHRDAEAREVFRALVELTHEPRALARLAATEAALGEWVAAEEHLRAALDARNDPWVRANRTGADGGLEGDLRRYASHVGRVEVLCDTPGAELWLRGSRVAELPMRAPLRVAAGTVTFELRASGYVTELRQETVEGGPDSLVRVSLSLSRSLPTREGTAVTPPPRVTPAPVVAPAPAPGAISPTSRAWWVLGLSATGVGLAGVALGVTTLVLRNGHATTFNDDPRCGVQNDVVVGGAGCQTEYDARSPIEAGSMAGFIAGGALLATGVTVLLVGSLSGSARPSRVTPTAGAGDVGLGLRASF